MAEEIKPDVPAPDPKDKKADDKPKKLELTQEEFDAKIAKAVKKREDELGASQKTKDDAAEAERQKQKGEYQTLYNSEVALRKQDQEKLTAAELTLRREQVHGRLRDHLAKNQPDYIATASYMQPLLNVTVDLNDVDADKQIKSVVEQYVKDNPRQKIGLPPPMRNKGGGGDGDPSKYKADEKPAYVPARQF